MMITNNQSYSNNDKFQLIGEKIRENIEFVLNSLDITDFDIFYDKVIMACPIHEGDNKDACNIFIGDKAYVVNWKCFTHDCQKKYNSGIFGFIQARLSLINKKPVKTGEAIKWCEDLFKNENFDVNTMSRNINHIKFAKVLNNNRDSSYKPIERSKVISKLTRPVHYYIDRGFKNEILNKYDIGICTDKNKQFYNRVVVPVYDQDNEFMIGCVGRTLYNKCSKCKYFHSKDSKCPDSRLERFLHAKWINSPGFRSENYFYNYWYAKEHIKETKTAIIVEGQGDVWKTVQSGIHNVLGAFGSSLSAQQKITLEKSGITNLIIFSDPDNAGTTFYNNVCNEIGRLYNIYKVDSELDPGESSEEKIQELIHPIFKKIGI